MLEAVFTVPISDYDLNDEKQYQEAVDEAKSGILDTEPDFKEVEEVKEMASPTFVVKDGPNETRFYVMGPNDKVRDGRTSKEHYFFGPGLVTIYQHPNGTRFDEYSLNDPSVWESVRAWAQKGIDEMNKEV